MVNRGSMVLAELADEMDFDGWRKHARSFAARRIAPEAIIWQVGKGSGDLFASRADNLPVTDAQFPVPRQFLTLAQTVFCHRDPERFALLYTLLLRLQGDKHALADASDPLVHRLNGMVSAVRRDIHKMRAFVRFRKDEAAETDRYVAWFEPEHHIVRVNARFFVNRFANMCWSILTPDVSIHWDGEVLRESLGASARDAPGGDAVEDQWKAYYAAIFNPARLKVGAMLSEMPRKYWKNMPETALVPGLIAGAQAREAAMIERELEAPDQTPSQRWQSVRSAALHCQRCALHSCATQTVFGEGPLDARLMVVGEQPGDQEDVTGRPFVGPAGQVLDDALREAGIVRESLYLTNAVKHFKFTQRGKRRIHDRPNVGEIDICRWWVDQERAIIAPQIVLALGATAARSILGRATSVMQARGRAIAVDENTEAWVTIHPSYLLRITDPEMAADERQRFIEDLKTVGKRLRELA